MVDFEIGASESRIIAAIVARARRLIERHSSAAADPPSKWRWLDMQMDLAACHTNGCPLDLDRLLKLPRDEFCRDLANIAANIDRETGHLAPGFVPAAALIAQHSEGEA